MEFRFFCLYLLVTPICHPKTKKFRAILSTTVSTTAPRNFQFFLSIIGESKSVQVRENEGKKTEFPCERDALPTELRPQPCPLDGYYIAGKCGAAQL
jgi:hypothetical protein